MKFAFRQLALQVYQFITPSQLIQPTDHTLTVRQTTRQLAENLQIDFMEKFYKATKKKTQKSCVHSTQSCMVDLSDKLQYYIAQTNRMPVSKTSKEEIIAFYTTIEEQLLHLLNYLQKNMYPYFNTEQKMPENYRLQTQQYFLQSVGNLENKISKGTSPPILRLITEPIKKYYSSGTDCCLNYNMYQYWKTLLGQLLTFTTDEHNTCIQTLILHNFNHGSFINQVMETWCQSINQLETTAEKTEQWAIHLRTINRLHPLPGMHLYKNIPTCKQLLLQAIDAEITIHQTQPANLQQFNLQPLPSPIQTTLSVPQLAGMIRLLVDTGILTCDNQTLLLKDISRAFATRHQKEVSPESLRQKYYHQDSATISILKTHLTNMMGQLRNY